NCSGVIGRFTKYSTSIFHFPLKPKLQLAYNARLRGWQRIPLNSNTTTATTAAQWDWKRHALTVPLEAFVKLHFQDYNDPIKDHIKDRLNDH
ncbi:hypothetical protein, partial [Vibrio cholerae]